MATVYQDISSFSVDSLTSSSSGSSLHVSVCGTIWPSNQSTSWLCETAHEPHGSPSSFSFHGGQGDSHAVCGATQCVHSGAINDKANMNFNPWQSHSILINVQVWCGGNYKHYFSFQLQQTVKLQKIDTLQLIYNFRKFFKQK